MTIITIEMDDQDAKELLWIVTELSKVRPQSTHDSLKHLAERLEASLDEVGHDETD